ncbi:MAG: hypothetical protein P4L99_23760 [Chthoniobacter sp.]|nr:hypothetical protein [Chthoniobacter sp.]
MSFTRRTQDEFTLAVSFYKKVKYPELKKMKTNTAFPEVLHYDPSHPACETPAAADLFPDLLHLSTNHRHRGRIATVLIESDGVGVQHREVTIDPVAWAECVKSPNFRACYDLSMAKLALQEALGAR